MGNLSDPLFAQAAKQPGKIALYFEAESYTFFDLARNVQIAATALSAVGIIAGDRVGLVLPSGPDFIILQYALFLLGGTVVPINPRYHKHEIDRTVADCGVAFVVTVRDLVDHFPQWRAKSLGVSDVFVVRAGKAGAETTSADRFDIATDLPIAPADVPDHATALMLCTSATTGRAKAVELSVANIRSNYGQTPAWLGLTANDVILGALPLYNTFALNQCISSMVLTGAALVLLAAFDVAACLVAIENYKCTFFPAVPTMLQRLFDHAETRRHDISSIGRIMTGGAPVPAPLLERIRSALGPHTVVMTGYGLTEATALVTLDEVSLDSQGNLRRPGSIGRVLDGIELIVDGSGQTAEDDGRIGEFLVRGPNVMNGYFTMAEETAIVLVDGWLHTGDIGYIDADGYAYIVDRKKDIVIRGGQNIYPAEIEAVLYSIDGVCEAAVIGVPDSDLGEVPVGFVVLQPGATACAEDIIAQCRDRLARFKVPATLHILPELPKGPTGKILKRALRVESPSARPAGPSSAVSIGPSLTASRPSPPLVCERGVAATSSRSQTDGGSEPRAPVRPPAGTTRGRAPSPADRS